jgi:hypothetical protein
MLIHPVGIGEMRPHQVQLMQPHQSVAPEPARAQGQSSAPRGVFSRLTPQRIECGGLIE